MLYFCTCSTSEFYYHNTGWPKGVPLLFYSGWQDLPSLQLGAITHLLSDAVPLLCVPPLQDGWWNPILQYQVSWSLMLCANISGCLNWVYNLLCPSGFELHVYVDPSKSIAHSYSSSCLNHYNSYMALYFMKYFQGYFLLWSTFEIEGFILLFLIWTRRD